MRRGRPSKLTAELHGRVVDAVRAGNYIETAAAYAGITKDTLLMRMKRADWDAVIERVRSENARMFVS